MLRCARRRCSSASVESTIEPRSRSRSSPHAPPSRPSASRSAVSTSYALTSRNGGGWLITSCVIDGPVRGATAMGLLLGSDGVDDEGDERGDECVGAALLGERADERLLHGADHRGG